MVFPVQPDPRYLIEAARNQRPARMPIYEHIINVGFIEKATGQAGLGEQAGGNHQDRVAFFRAYNKFFMEMGYDCISYEFGAGGVMPGSGALGGHVDPVIKTRQDFDRYPWDALPDLYEQSAAPYFEAMEQALPSGMLLIGGVGNGVFECAQDLTGYMNLCLLRYDDPQLYADLFLRIQAYLEEAWRRLLSRWGHLFAICRTGDDLGFRTQTLIPLEDIQAHVVPGYRRIADLAHRSGKPYLLHSCGCIFDAMDSIIKGAGIDAKHSNEDQIALFPEWIDRYNDRIALFGGIDLNVLYRGSEASVRDAVGELCEASHGWKGYALGSGNSIPDDIPVDRYLAMVDEANRRRGTCRS